MRGEQGESLEKKVRVRAGGKEVDRCRYVCVCVGRGVECKTLRVLSSLMVLPIKLENKK